MLNDKRINFCLSRFDSGAYSLMDMNMNLFNHNNNSTDNDDIVQLNSCGC